MWSPDDIETAMRDYPGILPGIVVSIVVGFIISGRLGRALGVGRILGYALVMSATLILSATLTPGGDAPHDATSCDFSRVGPVPFADILVIREVGLNILLFVPLGVVLSVLPRSQRKAGLLVAAIALPFIIEAIQLLAVPLERACQSADVADNLTGLCAGYVVGTLAGAAALRLRGHPLRRADVR